MDFSPNPSMDNFAVLRDDSASAWRLFRSPVEIVVASRAADVLPLLRHVEQTVESRRLHAAGWISYEAAPGFDPALAVRDPGPFPLLWFGLYETPEPVDLPLAAGSLPKLDWSSTVSPESYALAFDHVKRRIRAGDTYQVNFTQRLRAAPFDADPWLAFLALVRAQRPPFGAYLSAGPWRIASASPELFFRLDGAHVESRPMKGTAPRGRTPDQDRAQAAALLACEKNRAENLMIVDMVRHDLGRIARPGSVQANALCAPEKYPTLWQLVSSVSAETDASVAEILAATFPPASITGAPKSRTMEIIAGLESYPRQIYTGAIGFISPGRRAQFNVAIRTLLVDVPGRRAEYGVGGGIVWDSALDAEQAECRTKARILAESPPPFSLLETMLWTPAEGFHLLDRHVLRMRASAEYFDVPFDESTLRRQLDAFSAALPPHAPRRIRLLLSENGAFSLQDLPLPPAAPLYRLAIARQPVDPANPFLYHKTTHRSIYEQAKSHFPAHDDVVLFNEDGLATESTIANLVAEIDGTLCTPPLECGLLPGTARADLLARGLLREQTIPIHRLRECPRLFLLNSVRGLFPAVLDAVES